MYAPNFKISPTLVSILLKIDKLKNEILAMPLKEDVLRALRKSAAAQSSHNSTYIEGNKLTLNEVEGLLYRSERVAYNERDEKEVLGYYVAFEDVKGFVESNAPLSELAIQQIHGLVMAEGAEKVSSSPYRDGQNVIRDSRSGDIVYLPPEAEDVPRLMNDLVHWLIDSEKNDFPAPISAAIAHYQFATIHPYYDGNGRTARLFTSWILQRNGYGLKGICSLEGYYAQDLQAYYDAISIGSSHNYYFGRPNADITPWVEYFCQGMLESFQRAKAYAKRLVQKDFRDDLFKVRSLSKKQRVLLEFFKYHDILTTHDVELLFKMSGRTARNWVKKWSEEGFLVVDNSSKKKRTYRLAQSFKEGFC